MAREHVKLWRYESARFRALPYAARALAAYLLKFVDEGGHLPLGKRKPVDAVAIAVGADPFERRALKPAVTALLEHEYLVVTDGLLVVGNFPRYQEERDVSTTRDEREMNARQARARREVDATLTRDEREIPVSTRKDVGSDLVQNVLSSEKRSEEERESQTRAPKGIPLDARITHSDAQDTFSRLRVAHGGGPFRASQREYTRVSELADFANAQGSTRAERLAALETTIRGYLSRADTWATDRGWPVTGMQDFGVCLAAGRKLAPARAPQAAPTTPLGRLKHELHTLVELHSTGAFATRPQAERIASIERREAIEREIAAMGKAS